LKLVSFLLWRAHLGAPHHLDACAAHLLQGPRDVARLQLDATAAVLDSGPYESRADAHPVRVNFTQKSVARPST